MKFLHTVAVQDQAISADGIYTYDLAVNPLSVVIPVLRPLNDTGTLANFQSYLNMAKAINRISILFRGESIVSMRGEDAAALGFFRHGFIPFQGNHDSTDNERRACPVPILMGKHAYDPTSCFPATRRGELVLELDLDIADTGYDGLRLSVETIELLDAKPILKGQAVPAKPPGLNAGDGNGTQPAPNLTADELQAAASLGMTPESYHAFKGAKTLEELNAARSLTKPAAQ